MDGASVTSNTNSNSDNSSHSSQPPKKEKVPLSDAEEVTLAILRMRSIDCQAPNPILGCPYAAQVLERCDFNPNKSYFVNDQRWVAYTCNRSKTLDKWCQQFLDSHPDEPLQVLHVGCGLDSRNLRVRWADRPDVRWIDVDVPAACELRRRVNPVPPEGADYSLRSLLVTEPGWFRDVPCDRTTVIVMEGVLPLISQPQAETLLRGVVDYFGAAGAGGQLLLDVIGTLVHKHRPVLVQKTAIQPSWGIDDARALERVHPKLKMTARIRWVDYLGNEASWGQSAPPLFGPWTTALLAVKNSPAFKDTLQILRFDFGDRAVSVGSSDLPQCSEEASLAS